MSLIIIIIIGKVTSKKRNSDPAVIFNRLVE